MSEFRYIKTDMSKENVGNYSSRGGNLNDGTGNECSQCIYHDSMQNCNAESCRNKNISSRGSMSSVEKIRQNAIDQANHLTD